MSARDKHRDRGSCAPSTSDAKLLSLFAEMDTDRSGELSIDEMTKALQTNGDFARVCTGNPDSKPLPAMAARLIAQNIQTIFDTEFGNDDGLVSRDEVRALLKRRLGAHQLCPQLSRTELQL